MLPQIFLFSLLCFTPPLIQAQSYENNRCKCICPSTASVINNTQTPRSHNRNLYIAFVPPDKCHCDGVILPKVGNEIKGKEQEYCAKCACKYEYRNTAIIRFVVIICIWVISLLVVYMLFLICLDPLLNKRSKGNYQEHTNEEVGMEMDETASGAPGTSSHQMGVRGNVLNRVGHQQDKWKRQVKEQRKNIYDRHTMLN